MATHKKRFSIRSKMLLLLAATVTMLIVLISVVVGMYLKKVNTDQFHSKMLLSMQLIDHEINLFFDNAKNMITMLASQADVCAADTSFNEYMAKKDISDVTTIAKSQTEQKVFDLFKNIDDKYADYVCVFMGTEAGGYTSSADTALSGGYDPRKRPWYTSAMQTAGMPVIAHAYQSTVGSAVVSLSHSIVSNNSRIGAVSIEVTLKKLTDFLSDIKIGSTGYVMLIQDDGIILADPKHTDLNFRHMNKTPVADFAKLDALSQGCMSVIIDGEEYLAQIDTIKHLNWKMIAFMKTDEVYAAFYKVLKVMFLTGFTALIVSFVLSVFFSTRIVRSLRTFVQKLKNISEGEGDLTITIPLTGHDEITEVSFYFNKTIEKIAFLVKRIRRNLDTMKGTGKTLSNNMTETACGVQQIEENITDIKDKIVKQSDGISEVFTAIREIMSMIQQLGESIKTQSSSVTQSSAVIENMAGNIDMITDTLLKTDHAITNLAEVTGAGQKTIASTTAVTQKISEESGSLMDASSVIQHIASQTNLLAMNAAIEAAHAGEAGKGFAVVADEIRKLAEESSSQGKTITATLKNLRAEMLSLAESSKEVEEKFTQIFKTAHDVQEMRACLTNVMQEQKNGSVKVLSAIHKITKITEEVGRGFSTMYTSGATVSQHMTVLNEVSSTITENINEISASVVQIRHGATEVNNLSSKNQENIKILSNEVQKFKV